MHKAIPAPISGGLILSYKCSAQCRHCIYACSQKWDANWISEDNLYTILNKLSGRIISDPKGPNSVGLNTGLHFTGGEPFLNFDLLCKASELATKLKIPSTFVETNCFWAIDDKTTKEKLKTLKAKGLKGIMISVNPFYLEYVPFERTDRVIRISLDIFGQNVMVYQLEYYRRFKRLGLNDKISLERYLQFESQKHLLNNVEFFPSGRAVYRLKNILQQYYPLRPAKNFFNEKCLTPFLRNWHNHFDNYGNYIPGFCAGISLGDARRLDTLLDEGLDTERYPVLKFLIDEDIKGLYNFAKERGFIDPKEGFFSKCHLCLEIRKYLCFNYDYKELQPKQFYLNLLEDEVN
ncbi:MAG: radical SAM protein [Thermodesulfovibrionales bacterium]|nr:radical SAM protein [Thermodesulfovibrionales bacterium]